MTKAQSIKSTHSAGHHPRHSHTGLTRPENELSSTGVTWDAVNHEWVEDSEEIALQHERQQHTDGGSSDTQLPENVAIPAENTPADDVVWLEWEKGDPQNPFNWSSFRKWVTAGLGCLLTMSTGFSGASFPIGNRSFREDLGVSRELASLAFSAYPLGFGLCPLVTAPFSEAFGRYRVYVVSCLIYTIFFVPMAVGQNTATVIVARFISGLAGSTGSTLVGGTISDVFEAKDRGLAMSVFAVGAFAGTGLAPGVMGYVEQNLGWRWIQYIQLIFNAVLTGCIIIFTRETRGSVILSRRAAKMRKETGDPKYQCRADAERASLLILIKYSLSRPIYLLFTEYIVFFFSLWVALAWGFLYLSIEVTPRIMEDVYGFREGATGLVMLTAVVAALIGFLANYVQEYLYRKYQPTKGPEARLYLSMYGGILFPLGCWVLAFTQGRGHWMGPLVGLTMVFAGIFHIYTAVFSYLADCYTIYASSALSGQSLCRNLAGFAFPLFTNQLYDRLGYTWGTFLTGGLAALLAPTPFVLYFWGPTIRAKSNFAKELARMQAKQEEEYATQSPGGAGGTGGVVTESKEVVDVQDEDTSIGDKNV